MIMASIKTAQSHPQYTQELPHDTQGQLAACVYCDETGGQTQKDRPFISGSFT